MFWVEFHIIFEALDAFVKHFSNQLLYYARIIKTRKHQRKI